MQTNVLYYDSTRRIADRMDSNHTPAKCWLHINDMGIFVSTPSHHMVPVTTQETGIALCRAWHEDQLGYFLAIEELLDGAK